MIKKLIEVALPLEKINAESAREKSIRHGHPSTLHLWWARRPLAAARAVIWSSLVDDPSSHPELFPTEESQNTERKRLFQILEKLVIWENSKNEEVLKEARNEILCSTNGNPPALLDPFAGGGAIPLEAQRLGLEAHAHDLNPVAVMINKAMIEIPPRFANMPPVNPDSRVSSITNTWNGAKGLAMDIQYYGMWVKSEAYKRIGHLYPLINDNGKYRTVIAWLWARMTACENPACGKKMPLVSSYIVSKKRNKEAWVEPITENGEITFKIHFGKCPAGKESPKQGRAALFKCPFCGNVTTDAYIKEQGKAHNISSKMMAIVAEGEKGRIYLSPNKEHELGAQISVLEKPMLGSIPKNPRWFSPPAFGMKEYADLFTNRQIVFLQTLTSLIEEVKVKVEEDAASAGMPRDHISFDKGGSNATAYADAVGTYIAFVIDKLADYNSALCSWHVTGEKLQHTFGRQALPMIWDYAEVNPFCSSSGCFDNMLRWVVSSTENLPCLGMSEASQHDAQRVYPFNNNIMVSTDPPYYDNIGYADLSDFFYAWMRLSLKKTFPGLFSTVQAPKAEELVATPYHFNGDIVMAKTHFENGMLEACRRMYQYSRDDIPVSIYYAYKQSDSSPHEGLKGKASSGWETMLSAVIQAGFSITGTWPMRTEMSSRAVALGTNALASSIVLVCRKRPGDAPQITRRNLINILRQELRPALKRLQESNIAPVDLAQSAIGPGMGVFSRYRNVLEADGTPMSVRSALQVINEEIDLYFNEQVGEMDAMSRFCIDLYTQSAFNDIKFGDADILARAKGTSVASIAAHDVVYAKAGIVHLLERAELPETIDKDESCIWLLTQQLTQAMATGGVEACAKAVFSLFGSNAERAKDLAYRLYTIAEQKKWASEAYAYNSLVVAWPDIQTRAAMLERETPQQIDLFEAGLIE